MERFSVDESGYTGFDLLNRDQRFQGAAAVAICDADAKALIAEHFPRLQASELKYGALARRPKNRQRLVSLQKDVLANYKCITYVCNKRFLLVLMFLDYATEPWYFERGVNFYEDGQNYSMASLLYYIGPALLGKEAFDSILAAFQLAAKEKTPRALGDLVARVQHSSWEAALPEALGPIARGSPECIAAIATPRVSTDAAIVVLQSLITRLEAMSDGPYIVEHDKSQNLLQYNRMLRSLIEHDQAVEFTQSEIARIKFPLKLAEVTQVDSKDSPSVQIADVLIGGAIDAANALAGRGEAGSDLETIINSYRDDQIVHLMPSLDFAEQKSFRRGTQAAEVIEYFSKHFHK